MIAESKWMRKTVEKYGYPVGKVRRYPCLFYTLQKRLNRQNRNGSNV